MLKCKVSCLWNIAEYRPVLFPGASNTDILCHFRCCDQRCDKTSVFDALGLRTGREYSPYIHFAQQGVQLLSTLTCEYRLGLSPAFTHE